MILDLDVQLFHFINQALSSSVLDAILIPIRDKYVWIPVYIFIISFSLINHKMKGYYLIVFLILTVGISDMLSNKGFKHTVKRARPCQVYSSDEIDLKVRCGSGYSFTSNHAANHFSLSMFLFFVLGGSVINKYRWILLLWAFLIALAQVYVGVHYPLDVFCGSILGIIVAYIGFTSYKTFQKRLIPKMINS